MALTRDSINSKYNAQIAELEAQRAKEFNHRAKIWYYPSGNRRINRAQIAIERGDLNRRYRSKINFAKTQRTKELHSFDYAAKFGSRPLTQRERRQHEGTDQSLVGVVNSRIAIQKAQAQAARNTSKQNAISNAIKAEQSRQIALRESQIENKRQQIVATTKQNQKVRQNITSAGYDPSKLKRAELRPSPRTKPVSKPAPKGTKQDPFKAKQPDLSKLSPYLKSTTKKPSTTPTKLQVRIDNIKTESQQKAKAEKAFAETKKPQTPSSFTPWRVGEKSFFTKQAAENYGLSHQPISGLVDFQTVQTYTVTTPDGKTRTFNNESTANEFIKRIKGSYQTYTVTTPDGKTSTFNNESTAKEFLRRAKEGYQTYGSYIGFGPDGAPIQGPPKPESTKLSNEVNFITGKKEPDKVITPLTMYDLIPEPKAQINTKSDNILETFAKETYNSLRYSDAVYRDEVLKPQGLEYLNYYASKGLSSIYNIPLALIEDKTMTPAFSETVINTGVDLALKGKTETHDPIGDYIRDDPLGTLVQLPAEAALWWTSAKALSLALKGIKLYSPLSYQTLKFPINDKMQTVYRGVTMKDKPILGVQNGKLVIGFDETKLPFKEINPDKFNRYGWESTQSTGIASGTIFAEKTLNNMVKRKIITKLNKERIDTFKDLYAITKGVKTKTGKFSPEPIIGVTQKQFDYLLNYAKAGQMKGTVDTLHGSAALHPQISKSLRTQAGSHLKLGDLDLEPKAKKIKDIPKVASKLIQGLKDFPLEKGQSIKIIDGINPKHNKQLILKNSDGSEKKIFEVVLEERNASGIKGIVKRDGTKVFDQKLVSKTVKTKDYALRIHARRFQLQENMRTALGFHKGDETLFNVYASKGRSKDIVRAYWNFKEDAIQVGGKKGKEIDAKAEYLRSLYHLDFEDLPLEKVLLLSSKQSKSTGLFDDDVIFSPLTIIPKTINVKNIGNQKQSDLDFLEIKSPRVKKPITNNSIFSKPASEKITYKSAHSSILSKPASEKITYKSAHSSILSKPASSKLPNSIIGKSVRGSGISLINSPKSPLINSPKSPLINSPKSPLINSPKSPLINSPKSPLINSPKSPLINSPKSPLINSPKSPLINSPKSPSIKSSKSSPGSLFGKSPFITGPPSITGPPASMYTKIPIRGFLPAIPFSGARKTKRRGQKDGRIFEFIGNSRSDNMIGIFDRDEITYGKKNIAKINKSDIAFIKKSKKNNKSLLSSINLEF